MRNGLREEKTCVLIEGEHAHRDQWVVGVRPDLGHVEDVPAVLLCLGRAHDLEIDLPRWVVTLGNGVVEVSRVSVRVLTSGLGCFILREVLDPLVGLDVNLDVVERAILSMLARSETKHGDLTSLTNLYVWPL